MIAGNAQEARTCRQLSHSTVTSSSIMMPLWHETGMRLDAWCGQQHFTSFAALRARPGARGPVSGRRSVVSFLSFAG